MFQRTRNAFSAGNRFRLGRPGTYWQPVLEFLHALAFMAAILLVAVPSLWLILVLIGRLEMIAWYGSTECELFGQCLCLHGKEPLTDLLLAVSLDCAFLTAISVACVVVGVAAAVMTACLAIGLWQLCRFVIPAMRHELQAALWPEAQLPGPH